jgi:hypothetical protein
MLECHTQYKGALLPLEQVQNPQVSTTWCHACRFEPAVVVKCDQYKTRGMVLYKSRISTLCLSKHIQKITVTSKYNSYPLSMNNGNIFTYRCTRWKSFLKIFNLSVLILDTKHEL